MPRGTDPIVISGGGPAGSSAAIAAQLEGSTVRIVEKSKFPRHKVCGEFFSPEIARELHRLGAWQAFLDSSPARIRRMKLHFGRRPKICNLPEPAWGLSRYAFDHLLLQRARALGAEIVPASSIEARVVASGRAPSEIHRGRRLFGFKAHFTGPVDDAVELFFFDGCYVGVNTVEGGRTNVCGLGPEDQLRRFHFDYDAIVRQSPALAHRLAPLNREMKWISTGPLRYTQRFSPESAYFAGDALSFVDPFTGSGLLAAVRTGALAGIAAARHDTVAQHVRRCRASLKKPFEIAGLFRKAVETGWADRLAGLVPGRFLFALTRPGK
ncbi:MAG TPA: NAD(P)/FAD-dependent oxidoreductase [Bryobacteraceae bacterium]|nr:NAD(P)/FAD-dependent oxidoreductase [Bryobacteraceae bacterium]